MQENNTVAKEVKKTNRKKKVKRKFTPIFRTTVDEFLKERFILEKDIVGELAEKYPNGLVEIQKFELVDTTDISEIKGKLYVNKNSLKMKIVEDCVVKEGEEPKIHVSFYFFNGVKDYNNFMKFIKESKEDDKEKETEETNI